MPKDKAQECVSAYPEFLVGCIVYDGLLVVICQCALNKDRFRKGLVYVALVVSSGRSCIGKGFAALHADRFVP